jgi:hypothetical protein
MLNEYSVRVGSYSHMAIADCQSSQHGLFCAWVSWSKMSLVKDKNVMAVMVIDDVNGLRIAGMQFRNK